MVDWRDIHPGFAEKPPQSGWTYEQWWEKYKLTYSKAQLWSQAGFTPYNYNEVNQWKNHNFTPQQTKSWISVGLNKEDTDFVAYLRNKNHQPDLSLNLEQLRKEFDAWIKNKTAQEYLDFFYPQEARNIVEMLDISRKNLVGSLDLSDFVNLELLYCYSNQLTSLNLDNCLKLKELACSSNNLQDLSFLSHLVNLEKLYLDNNKFKDSLRPLQNLSKLSELFIGDNDIDSGLEYLPESIVALNCLVNYRKEAKVKAIYNLFVDERGIAEENEIRAIKNFPQKLQAYKQKPQVKAQIEEMLTTEKIISEQLTYQLINDNYIINPAHTWQDYLNYAQSPEELDIRKGKILVSIKNLKKKQGELKKTEERRIISSLIPTERLFVIRGNIKQFLNKWNKPHENDWYEWLKKKIKRIEENRNELAKLQSPEEAKLDKGIIVGYRVLNNGLATAGIVLSFQGKSDIGAGLLGVYPINEFIITYLEKSLNNRETKWKEFQNDADTLSDNSNELLGILKKIDDDSVLGKTRTVKSLNKRTEELLKTYDEDKRDQEGYGEIDLEELIKERAKLSQDLANKTEGQWWGIIKDIRKLEDLVINYQKTGSLVEKTIDNSEKDNNQVENHHAVNVETEQQAQILQKEPCGIPGSSKTN